MQASGSLYLIHGAALDAGAVKFDFEKGFPFVSGIVAPIYIDTRKLWFDPAIREKAVNALAEYIDQERLEFDTIAGVESGAIAPAALLASKLQKRFVYVKKKAKEHGLKRMIECGDVEGSNVLLLEDLVSTGGSSVNGIEVLRSAGAIVHDCLAVHSYDFGMATENFSKADVRLHPLVLVGEIAHEAAVRSVISLPEEERVVAWLKNPHQPW
ncbi:MAG: phosphoribosyltransferase family protein [Patescibacteria group bacterium]